MLTRGGSIKPVLVLLRGDGWLGAALIATAVAILLLALTPATTLWDRDEPRFAQTAVEMLSSGDYLVPTFNGELRAQKPPLVYWLMTRSLSTFGHNELAARFWSPIGVAITALATFAIGRRLWSAKVGLVSMIVLVSSPLVLIEGIIATTDAILLAWITVSLALITTILHRPPTWIDAGLLGIALGAGLLTKGPIALVLPTTIAALTCWVLHREIAWTRQIIICVVGAAIVGLSIFAAWLVPANVATAGEMMTRGIVQENFWRALEPMEGHGTPWFVAPLYYPAVVAVGFAPWVLVLPAAMRRIPGEVSWRSLSTALVGCWIAVPLVVFTLAATKLPHYVLPIWPALSLVVAVVVVGASENATKRAPQVRWILVASLVLPVAIAVGAPLVERVKPVPPIAAALRHSAVIGPLFVYGFGEPSLVFYSGRRIVPLESEAALVAWTRTSGAALLVAPRAAIDATERSRGSLGLRELAAKDGWNYVKGERMELVAFVRSDDR